MKKLMISALALMSLSPLSANAHAVLEKKHAQAQSTYKAVIGVTHGCEGEATLKVHVKVPEGFVAVKPMPKAGWAVETVNGKYEKTYDFHGPRSEGVKEIIWTGSLEDHHYDEFVFRGYLTDKFAKDDIVAFPTVQTCANGKHEWVDIPHKGHGHGGHHSENPAPALTITGKKHKHH